MRPQQAVLLDVGSTNSRGWLVDGVEVVRREARPVGVRDTARDGSPRRVRETVRALVDALTPAGTQVPVFAAGMIGSPLGLAEVPHLAAPAGIAELAAAVAVFEDTSLMAAPVALVPGVRTGPASNAADAPEDGLDVMRGEETLVCGLLAAGALHAGAALMNVSSHWKLIRTDAQRRVASSRTSLGGELVHAVQAHTLLAAALPAGPLEASLPDWLDAGAQASRRDGLLRALFRVRLLEQQGRTSPEERFAFFAGACISEDVDALLASGAIVPDMPIAVSGPAAVPAAWAHLLARAGCHPEVLDAATIERGFIAGLVAIACLWHETAARRARTLT